MRKVLINVAVNVVLISIMLPAFALVHMELVKRGEQPPSPHLRPLYENEMMRVLVPHEIAVRDREIEALKDSIERLNDACK